MAGRNIKIELELPEFEKELNITVTLQRDGEVLSCTSSSQGGIKSKSPVEDTPKVCKSTSGDVSQGWKQSAEPSHKSTPTVSATPLTGGNMMNINF